MALRLDSGLTGRRELVLADLDSAFSGSLPAAALGALSIFRPYDAGILTARVT